MLGRGHAAGYDWCRCLDSEDGAILDALDAPASPSPFVGRACSDWWRRSSRVSSVVDCSASEWSSMDEPRATPSPVGQSRVAHCEAKGTSSGLFFPARVRRT